MKQIWTVAKKEFKTAFKDKIFISITLLFILLSILSVYIGSSTKHAELKAYSDIIDLLKSQGSKAFPPKPEIFPLAILGNIITYVSIIGGMLAIFLGFDTFTTEKENGTLKLLLSKPIYRDQLLTGKLVGGALVIGVVLFVTLVFNVILYTFASGVSTSIGDVIRLSIFMIIAFCYMMSFYIATVFVSINTKDRAFGFMIMLIVWVAVSFVLPQLAASQKAFAYSLNSTAQTVTQLPSDTTVSKAMEIFSPTVHFQNIGGDLLQTSKETAKLNILNIVQSRSLTFLYMMFPGIIMLFACYKTFLREDG